MKVYIAGKITGDPMYHERFADAEQKLLHEGHSVLNPAILPPGFDWDDYMYISQAMLTRCDAVYFLANWKSSKGASIEMHHALLQEKKIMFENPEETEGEKK